MYTIEAFQNELEAEAKTTRTMLERVPDDKLDWQPHPKSMTLQRLASHVAELPGWIDMAVRTDALDFQQQGAYEPVFPDNNADLLAYFEKSLAAGRKALTELNPNDLPKKWTLRNGDEVLSDSTKQDTIHMALCQTIHHRAQLGVYLRLLDIPIPGSYGPSADESGEGTL